MARKYLLAIDGGGLRGIIPLSLLIKLEATTGLLTRETFSFVAGTSTGALITAGIAAGVPAARILELYLADSRKVFTQRPWNILNRVVSGAMYSTEQLHAVIASEIGAAASWTLNDSPIDLLITATGLEDGKAWYFVRDHPPANSGRTGRLNLVDCITASAAAPTYFPPWPMPEPSVPPGATPIGRLVDGGIGVAGNPVYQACVEAFYYTGAYTPAETTIVSLGTGRYRAGPHGRWIGAWLTWLFQQLVNSPGEQQTQIVQRHFPDAVFYRLDYPLPRDVPIDDVNAVPEIQRYGTAFAAQVDWTAILAGAHTPALVQPGNTLFPQYTART